MAGITATSADPPSGTVVRLADGTPAGVLIEAGALDPVRRLLPPVTEDQQAGLLARQCQLYNRSGIGVGRDPGLVPDEVPVYQAVADRGELTTRTRLMFWVLPRATVAETLAYVDSLPSPGSVPGYGGGLGIWGLKMGVDGGVEGEFLCQPYANNPSFRRHAFWEPDDFEQVVEHAVGRGWRIGCHAVGDCAVRRVLDAYERVAARHPGLPPGTLVIEHAFLADAQTRARAVRLGVGITVQHPLLYSLGGNLVRYWGEERARSQDPHAVIFAQQAPAGRGVEPDGRVGVHPRLGPLDSHRAGAAGHQAPDGQQRVEEADVAVAASGDQRPLVHPGANAG
jgi:predicted amidohydrolase YtcJ